MASLLSLPLEILLEIVERLAEGDLQGVHAFSLVNKRLLPCQSTSLSKCPFHCPWRETVAGAY